MGYNINAINNRRTSSPDNQQVFIDKFGNKKIITTELQSPRAFIPANEINRVQQGVFDSISGALLQEKNIQSGQRISTGTISPIENTESKKRQSNILLFGAVAVVILAITIFRK
tara:strand:- start:6873 stop:7214 length:342 start_codon:yes stop_codon:yes gene_type:complete